MDDTLAHTIKIEVTGRYPHGNMQHCAVEMSGTGDLEHFIDAFRAVLVAAGFSVETAGRVGMRDEKKYPLMGLKAEVNRNGN